MDFERLQLVPLWIIAFLISGAFHEFAHAWSAYKLGDETAAREGRMTLNPLPHIDPVGLIFLVLIAISGIGIGWMKPVPVNPYNLRNPRRDMMLISLAGPAANLILAAFFIVVIKVAPGLFVEGNPISKLLWVYLILNVVLAVFNLLPLYPLDGSKIVEGLLPEELVDTWAQTYRFGFIILIVLFFTGILWRILDFVVGLVLLLIAL